MLPVVRFVKHGAANGLTALLLGSIVLFGCSLKGASKGATLSLVVPNPGAHGLVSHSSSPRFGVAPAAWNDSGFKCYGINVVGQGIADSSPNPKPPMTDFSELIAGTKSCAYRGVVSNIFTFPVGGEDVTVNVQVPPGASRIVQLVGITNQDYCNSGFLSPVSGSAPGAYEIGHAVADLFGDATVEIPITYSATESKRVDCGSGAPATITASVTFTSPAAASYIYLGNQGSVSLTGYCSELGEPVIIGVNGGAFTTVNCDTGNVWTVPNGALFTGLTEAAQNFTADHSGPNGVATQATLALTKDTVTPSGATALTWGQVTPFNSLNVTAMWTRSVATDLDHQSIQFYSDGSCGTTYGSPITLLSTDAVKSFTAPSDGVYSYLVTSFDTAGNLAPSACSPSPMTIDTVMPSGTSISIAAGATYTTTDNVTLTLAATGASDMYITNTAGCASGGTWTAYSSGVAHTLGGLNTTATVYAKFRDAAGNETSCISDTIIHDNTLPTVAITSPAANSYVNSTSVGTFAVSGTCSDNGRDVVITGNVTTSTVTCTTGTWNATLDFSLASQGAVTINANHSDAAGNAATQASRSFIKDTVAPTVAVLTPNGAEIWAGSASESISWSNSDTNPGTNSISLSYYDGTAWNSIATSLGISGPYSWTVASVVTSAALVKVTYVDAAGNSAFDVSDAAFTISAPPVLSYSSSTGTTGTYGSPMSVIPSTLTTNGASITACGIKAATTALPVYLSVNPTTCEISGTPNDSLASTSYTLIATNSAGVSADATVSLSVNAIPPTLSYSSSTGTNGTVGLAMNVTPSILTTNGASITGCVATGLPPYFTINNTTCVISGVPTSVLPLSNFNVYAMNSAGNSTTVTVGLSVSAAWVWEGGSSTHSGWGTYGTQGIPSPSNVPGARSGAVTWTDPSGHLWMFGGAGYDSTGYNGPLNDVWKYTPSIKQWVWIGGPNTALGSGTYSTVGTPGFPSARSGAVSWSQPNGDVWIFGGSGNSAPFSDLWKFSAGVWTWMNGPSSPGMPATYGTLGTPDAANVPSARRGSVSWMDSNGDLWLFGGAHSNGDKLNDLWKYTVGSNQWAWMGGSNTVYGVGVYGTQGVGSTSNIPGSRTDATAWTDSSGNFWLFGGIGSPDGGATTVIFNDLWKFTPGTGEWTFINGSTAGDQMGVYGLKGVLDPANVPRSRYSSVAWTDANNNLWMFGGNLYSSGLLNELWMYSTSMNKWAWMDGNQPAGTYNTLGVANASSTPGGRQAVASWKDFTGNRWLLGGDGNDSGGSYGKENDLWNYVISKEIKKVGVSSANNSAGTTTLVISKPVETGTNLVMIAAITARTNTTTITPPAGWTQLQNQVTSSTLVQGLYYKVVTSSDEGMGSYTWTLSAAVKASGVIITYANVDTAAPVLSSNGQTALSTVSLTAPSLSSVEPEFQAVVFYGIASDSPITGPAGYTPLAENASTGGGAATRTRTYAAEKRWTAAGSISAPTATTGTAVDNIGQHVLLKRVP